MEKGQQGGVASQKEKKKKKRGKEKEHGTGKAVILEGHGIGKHHTAPVRSRRSGRRATHGGGRCSAVERFGRRRRRRRRRRQRRGLRTRPERGCPGQRQLLLPVHPTVEGSGRECGPEGHEVCGAVLRRRRQGARELCGGRRGPKGAAGSPNRPHPCQQRTGHRVQVVSGRPRSASWGDRACGGEGVSSTPPGVCRSAGAAEQQASALRSVRSSFRRLPRTQCSGPSGNCWLFAWHGGGALQAAGM